MKQHGHDLADYGRARERGFLDIKLGNAKTLMELLRCGLITNVEHGKMLL